MKNLKIWARKLTERTGFKRHPFKDKIEIVVCYDNVWILHDTQHLPSDPSIRIPFKLAIDTDSEERVKAMISHLGRTEAEKWLKNWLEANVLGEEK